MTAPIQPTAQPDPGDGAPDFGRLDAAAKLMRGFAGIGPDSPNFQVAQTGFAQAKKLFVAEAAKHKAFYGQQAQNQVAEPPQDLGISGAAHIGAAEGLGGAGGALLGAEGGSALGALGGPLAPVTAPLGGLIGGVAGYFGGSKAVKTAMTKLAPDPASAKAQYDLTVNAHPDVKLAGEIVTSLAAGGAIGIGQRVAARQALIIAQGKIKTGAMQRALDLTSARLREVEQRIASGAKLDPLQLDKLQKQIEVLSRAPTVDPIAQEIKQTQAELLKQRLASQQATAPAEKAAADLRVTKLQAQIDQLGRTQPPDLAAQQLELIKARTQLAQLQLSEETARLAHPERAATRQAAHETIQAKRDIAVAQAAKAKGSRTLQQWIADNSTRPVPPAITP
jgi:hypothetical protein